MKKCSFEKVMFQILTATSMAMAVFWDVAQCSLQDIASTIRDPDDGGGKHL
jgi:hypothetical protein